MERIQMGQIAKMLAIFFFIVPIPFIPDSIRSSYLYILLNIFIILLAIESGILVGTFSSDPSDEKTKNPAPAHIPSRTPSTIVVSVPGNAITISEAAPIEPPKRPAGRAVKTKENPAVRRVQAIKKCPSRPSLFFIGGVDDDQPHDDLTAMTPHDSDKNDDHVVDADVGEQELFSRAETFIRDFYRQLQIQREDSWKKIHGLYKKPF